MNQQSKQLQEAVERNAEEFAPMYAGHGSAFRFDGEDPTMPTTPVSYSEAWYQGDWWMRIADTIGGDAIIYHIPTGEVMPVPAGKPGK